MVRNHNTVGVDHRVASLSSPVECRPSDGQCMKIDFCSPPKMAQLHHKDDHLPQSQADRMEIEDNVCNCSAQTSDSGRPRQDLPSIILRSGKRYRVPSRMHQTFASVDRRT